MTWIHLANNPESHSRQMFIAGTRIMASSVSSFMHGNNLSIEETAMNMRLSNEVVLECVLYSEQNRELINSEIEEVLSELRSIA